MGNRSIIAALMLVGAPAWAGNYATCMLEKMPGVQNEASRVAVMQTCRHEHRAGYSGIEQGEGRGIFGFSDGNACIIKKAASTPFHPAAAAIAVACRCLYDKASQNGHLCDGTIRFPDGSIFDPSKAVPLN